MWKDTETLRFMTRFMITESKQRAWNTNSLGTTSPRRKEYVLYSREIIIFLPVHCFFSF